MQKLKTIGAPYTNFPLTTGAYRLGSATDAEFVLEDPSVAPYHCEVLVTSIITIRDISPNKETYIDDQKIETARLQPGQTLRLGNVKLMLDEPEKQGAAKKSQIGTLLSNTTEAKEKRARLYENVGMPLLVLLGIIGMLLLIFKLQSSDPEESSEPKKTDPATEALAQAAPTNAAEVPSEPVRPEPEPKPETAESKPAASSPEKVTTPDSKSAAPGQAALATSSNAVPKPSAPKPETAEAPRRSRSQPPLQLHDPRAGPVLEAALARQIEKLGTDDASVGRTFDLLGKHFLRAGQHDKAEDYMKQALQTFETTRGPNHPHTASVLDDLGELYTKSGQLDKAAPVIERALEIRQQTLSPGDPDLGNSMKNSARLNAAQGNLAKATQLMEQAARTHALSLTLDDPEMLDTLNTLAGLYNAQGDHARAGRLARAVARATEKALGEHHPSTAQSLNQLGNHLLQQGDRDQAASLLERAAESSESILGPGHPQTEQFQNDLARLNVCQGDPEKGLDLAAKALRSKRELLSAMLLCASEQQILTYRERLNPYSLSVLAHSVPELALTILQHKGILLDALLEQRLISKASRSPATLQAADRLRDLRSAMAQLLFEVPSDFSEPAVAQREKRKASIAREIERMEEDLARFMPGVGQARAALGVTLEAVQSSIPSGAVLLEFIRYSRCLGAGTWEPSYGAVVISSSGAPAWVPLGGAHAIEQTIQSYRSELHGDGASLLLGAVPAVSEATYQTGPLPQELTAGPPAPAAPARGDEASLNRILRTLYQQLWHPLQSALPSGLSSVIISPDAALNLVGFAALMAPDGGFLGANYSIVYVSSGRDLLRERAATPGSQAIVLGYPDFSGARLAAGPEADLDAASIRDADRQDLGLIQLPRLSSSIEQAAKVDLLFKRHNQPVVSYLDAEASEVQLTAAESPRLVHLATCGFYLPRSRYDAETEEHGSALDVLDPQSQSNTPAKKGVIGSAQNLFAGIRPLSNPLHRTGLALAGAQATFAAWSRGQNPPTANDGIVTADKIGTLGWNGTELVVLSSSDFGDGSDLPGESILALRRAFLQAGVSNLLITLREAEEEEADPILLDFYEKFMANGDAPAVLAGVQRQWLARVREERGLLAAVRLAGSFVLNSN